MTTQYTPTLKLALPVTGELSGTWGDVVNDNITSMIEQAIAGLVTINTWTGNAHTLTTANGTTSESRCAMLVAATGGGAPTAAAEIICPAAAKLYVLQNNTSYAVTLKTSAGTGVAVAAGDTAFLFCDGTNVNSCVTTIVNGNITGNLTVGGNATINGNTTLGNATSDTITATARFNTDLLPSTDNARDLGSAANAWKDLFIDGTATMALVAISGGTINGVSIGATTAATLINVDNLRLDGNTISSTDTNGNVVIAPNGTGDVQLDADTVRVGDAAAAVTLTSNGAGALTVTTGGAADLTLSTNSGTTSGTVVIANGVNGNITLTPDGTGDVILSADRVQIGDSNTDTTLTTNGTGSLNLTTNNGSNSGTIQIAQGVNGNITLTPNGTGSVSVPKLVWSNGTATRVPYLTTGGQFTDSANLTFNGTDLTVSGAVNAGSIAATTLDLTNLEVTNIKAKDGTAAITIADSTGAVSFANNVTLGDATTDAVTVNGYMGIGGAADSQYGLYVQSSALTGTNQRGIFAIPTATSAATSTISSIFAYPKTAAAAFTVTTAASFRADDAVKGAGSTITNLAGVYVADQTQGTNNYGVLSQVSSGANKFNIYASGTAQNYFAGDVTLGNGATLKIDDQDSITFGTFSAGTTGVLLQGGTSTSFLAYQAGKERMALGTTEAVFNDPGNDVDFRVESDTNTHALFVDAGNSRVGIDNSAPSQTLDVSGTFQVSRPFNSGITVARFYNSTYTGGAQVYDIAHFMATDAPAIRISEYDTTTSTMIGELTLSGGDANVQVIGSTGPLVFGVGRANGTSGYLTTGERLRLGSTESVFNDASADVDFRVESDGQSYAFFVDAGNNAVGINNSNPTTGNAASTRLTMGDSSGSSKIQQNVNGGGATYGGTDTVNNPSNGFRMGHINGTDRFEIAVGTNDGVLDARATSLTINQLSADQDFVVESDSYNSMLFVDAGLNRVGFATSSPVAVIDIPNLSNSNFPIVRFERDRASRIHVFSTGASTKTVTIDINDFGLTGFLAYVDVSGHNSTNGNDFWYDRYVWRLMEESGSTRINTRCTNYEFASGTSRVGSPTASFPGGGQSRITFTVTAGYDTKVWVKIEGVGAGSVTSIAVS